MVEFLWFGGLGPLGLNVFHKVFFFLIFSKLFEVGTKQINVQVEVFSSDL